MTKPLSSAQIRQLKALAQHLQPVLRIGKAGLTDAFIRSVLEALDLHELIKVKFADLKEQKKELAPKLAELTGSCLVTRVGNVAVLYKENPNSEKRKISFSA